MTKASVIFLFLATLHSQDPTDDVIGLTRAGQYEEARKVIQRLIDEAATFSGAYRASLWHWLGIIENNLSHNQEAQKALETGLQVAEENQSADPEVRVSLLAVLGEAHASQGHFREADRVLGQARAFAERELPAGHARLASVYDGFALLYFARGQASRAEVSTRQALRILERHYGADHPSVAVEANTLAFLLISMSRPAVAIPMNRILVVVASVWDKSRRNRTIRRNLEDLLATDRRIAEVAGKDTHSALCRKIHTRTRGRGQPFAIARGYLVSQRLLCRVGLTNRSGAHHAPKL